MSESLFDMVAIIGFVCAFVCTVVAVMMFFVLHIRAVHDELTGALARRTIEQMREGRRGIMRVGDVTVSGGAELSIKHRDRDCETTLLAASNGPSEEAGQGSADAKIPDGWDDGCTALLS